MSCPSPSPIILPANISSNALVSPTNSEIALGNRIYSVPVTSGTVAPSQKKFALITSLIFSNRIASGLEINAKVINGSTSAFLLYNVGLPPNSAFEVISNNKIILKEGDELYVWHNQTTPNVLDVMLSYTLHDPMTTYDI